MHWMNSWSREEVLALKKRAYGNTIDEKVTEKLNRLNAHLIRHDSFILPGKRRQEWICVEQIADSIEQLLGKP